MIKSPLRYPGGKSRAVKIISELILEFDEFREPFAGGGSVFVSAKQRFPNKKFWVNDVYFDLYRFWETARDDLDALVRKIYEWRNQFSVGKKLYRFLIENRGDFNDLETAAAFFIYNRITFSDTSLSGGFSQAAFDGRFTTSSVARLEDFVALLGGVKITNFDYEELITRGGENVFIYLDPPHFSATKSALYGKNGDLHKAFDHERFARVMRGCSHKWLVTYDDCEYVRDLFSFAKIASWELTYGMRNVAESSNQKGREIFISNYLE